MKKIKIIRLIIFGLIMLIAFILLNDENKNNKLQQITNDSLKNIIFQKQQVIDSFQFELTRQEYEDILICKELEIELKKREGLELYKYTLDSADYIYYGHLILRGEVFNHTEEEANNVLTNDIKKCYKEVKRLHKKYLKSYLFNMFTQGRYKYKTKQYVNNNY